MAATHALRADLRNEHAGSVLSSSYPLRFVPPMTTVLSRGSPAEYFEIPYLVTPQTARGLALPSNRFTGYVLCPCERSVGPKVSFKAAAAVAVHKRVLPSM